GQLFEGDFGRIGEVFGLGPRLRDAHRDQLADLAHLAAREDRLLGSLEALEARDGADRLDALEILGRKDQRLEPGGLSDGANPGVCHGRAHEGDFEHAGKPDVSDVLALPEKEALVFLARKPGPDPLCGHAASASGGRIEASASWRAPWRRQKSGRSMRSVRSLVPSLSRRVQRPRSSCSTLTSAVTPGLRLPTSPCMPSIRAGFVVTIGTIASSGKPSASIELIAETSEKRVWPKNMCSLSGCSLGVPLGAGTRVL